MDKKRGTISQCYLPGNSGPRRPTINARSNDEEEKLGPGVEGTNKHGKISHCYLPRRQTHDHHEEALPHLIGNADNNVGSIRVRPPITNDSKPKFSYPVSANPSSTLHPTLTSDSSLDAANAEAASIAVSLGVKSDPFRSKEPGPAPSSNQSTQSFLKNTFRAIGSKKANESNVCDLEGASSPVTNFQALSEEESMSQKLPSDVFQKDPNNSKPYVPPLPTEKVKSFDAQKDFMKKYGADPASLSSPSFGSGEYHESYEGEDPSVFDKHGQLAPYYEGPFIHARRRDGSRYKKRWYGRMEDGYIAWVSVNLLEQFGMTVYAPLNPRELREGKIPKWMYEFYSLPNLAIPLSYFCIGIALQLLRTPLIVYFIEDKNASAAEVNVLFTVMAVPWCFKVIYGFLSDCIPISGLRRKPYFMTGWLIYVGSNLVLTVTPMPSIQMCILLVFTQTAGYMLADVMTDALIVERSRFETQENRGTMQSKGYIIRFFGSVIGAAIGGVVYNKDEWDWFLPINVIFFINAAFPLLFLLPVVPFLMEIETECVAKNFFVQCRDLFDTAQLRSVWQPMTFVYIYNALQLTNPAWMNFLVEGLDFAAWEIGAVGVAGSIMAWFGIMIYKEFFFTASWRIVYFWCTTLASSICLSQIVLVLGYNRTLGIPDIFFSMGDDVLVEFVIAVQFLPMCIMYLGLCPEGSEGTTYAMLTTWSNLAGSLAFDISTGLTNIWDVSSETIEDGDYSGVWKLSLLCGIVGPLPLLLLGLIPKDKEDQRKLQLDTTRNFFAGSTFILVMILTLFVTFAESIYEVYFNNDHDNYDNQRKLTREVVNHIVRDRHHKSILSMFM